MDARTSIEKALDEKIGLPLYYCAECLRPVKVFDAANIDRNCDCDGLIYAPRRVFLTGVGGKVDMKQKLIALLHKLGSALTGRTIGVHHPKVAEMSAGISGSSSIG